MLLEDAAAVIAAVPGAAAVAIDIPIGLPAAGRRAADVLTRRRLGARRSSVFYAPPRGVLMQPTYAAANQMAKRLHGFGISKQSYMLRPKILEVDELVRRGDSIYEVHPELAFLTMGGAELPPKKSYGGARQRIRLLEAVGIELPDDPGPAGTQALDDVLDAAAAAWVADRIASGIAASFPDPPEIDETGLAMAIWC
jgi:predicted RNase H-like nuclease